MKRCFTAVYDTETMKDVHYSFLADDIPAAVDFCRSYFSIPIKQIAIREWTGCRTGDEGPVVWRNDGYTPEGRANDRKAKRIAEIWNNGADHIRDMVSVYLWHHGFRDRTEEENYGCDAEICGRIMTKFRGLWDCGEINPADTVRKITGKESGYESLPFVESVDYPNLITLFRTDGQDE